MRARAAVAGALTPRASTLRVGDPSNEVMWRESLAQVVRIRPGEDGLPDMGHLRECCERYKDRPLKIGRCGGGEVGVQ